MTHDQYDQARDSGYGQDDEAQEYGGDQPKPMTRFQKVASALRGDRADRDEADQEAPETTPIETYPGEGLGYPAATPVPYQSQGPTVNNPGTAADPDVAGAPGADTQSDYWDETPRTSAAAPAQTVPETNPDVPVPDGMAPGPDVASAGSTVPADAAPASAAPADVAPADAAPADAAPADAAPGYATPADVAPASVAPADAVPADVAPADAVPADVAPAGAAPADAAAAGGPGVSEAAPVGRHAGPEGGLEGGPEAGLRPGEAPQALGDFSDLTYGNLLPDGSQYQSQWQEIQFRFVDDPHGSVSEAADMVAQVTARLEEAIRERQRAIEERQRLISEQQNSLRGRWGEGSNADTEVLRETLRMYRTFLDQLIGPRRA